MFVKKRPGYLIHVIGIAVVLFLSYVLLFPSRPDPNAEGAPAANPKSPREKLEYYMNDAMNYALPYPRSLARAYIEDARKIAEEHPELGPQARRVIDSLEARLRRKAKYPY